MLISRNILASLTVIVIGAGCSYTASEKPTPVPSVSRPVVSPGSQPAQVVAPTTWTMRIMGDIMLDRYVRASTVTKGKDFPLAKIRDDLAGSDVVVANLEGPFTNQPSVATNSHLIFTFDPAMAPVLKSNGLTMLSLANNHTLNFGRAELDHTRAVLRSNGLDFFGDPSNLHGYGIIKNISGVRVAFLGYHAFAKGLDTILADIQEAKQQADFVVVMPHWGVEYALHFSAKQQQDAHAMIEAGADVVIGAHPHVVEPVEIYQGKFIAYSLGNFLFDQYFSRDTLEGMILSLSITGKNVSVNFIPVKTIKQQVTLLTGQERDALLARIASTSVVTDSQHQDIMAGQLVVQ